MKKTKSKPADVFKFFLFIIIIVTIFIIISQLLKPILGTSLAYITSTIVFFLSINPTYKIFNDRIIKK